MEKRTKNQLLVFLAGLVCVVFMLEAALFTGSRIFTRIESGQNTNSSGAGTFRILCLGDSFTFGLGAAKNRSYPAQLEELLRKEYPGQKIKVFNRGVCALNTSGILKNLEHNLNTTRPHLVTLMAGDPNFWDFRGMNEERGFIVRAKEFLSGLHSVKLVRLLFRDIKRKRRETKVKLIRGNQANIVKKIPGLPTGIPDIDVSAIKPPEDNNLTDQAQRLKDAGRYNEALRLLDHAMHLEPGNAGHFLLTGIICREQGHTKEAQAFLECAKKLEPENPLIHHQLGLVHASVSDMKTATELFIDAIALAPERIELYSYLAHSVTVSGSFDYAAKRLEKIGRASALAREYALFFRKQQSVSGAVTQWIERDVEKILSVCQKHGTQVILLGYPHEEERASVVIEKLAQKKNLVFVDNLSMFQALFLGGARYDEYFCPDTHPNEKGYTLIAENICREFVNYKIISSAVKTINTEQNA